jgi:hypothetical protein
VNIIQIYFKGIKNMSTNYRGESYGKKMARLEFWKNRNIKALSQSGRKIGGV